MWILIRVAIALKEVMGGDGMDLDLIVRENSLSGGQQVIQVCHYSYRYVQDNDRSIFSIARDGRRLSHEILHKRARDTCSPQPFPSREDL